MITFGYNKQAKTNIMTLTFGKFKGEELNNTPQWYQNWLNQQDWFKAKFSKPVSKSWGVYYMPTKQGRIFAGLKPELVAKFDNQDDAIECCNNLSYAGTLDELHSGYDIRTL